MAEGLWRDVAAAYDASFATLCAGAVPSVLEHVPATGASERAGRPVDGTVLDVGCGSGHLSSALAVNGRRVVALDPDPQMLVLTRERSGVPVVRGCLPDLPLPTSCVDAVVAGFVLNHVDDPQAGATELARVTRPGGTVVATIWPATPPPQALVWGEVLEAAGAVLPDLPRLPEHLDFERSPQGLAGLLARAGLEVVERASPRWEWRVRPDRLWEGLTAVGNFGVAWRAQDSGTQAQMRAAYDDAHRPWLDGDLLTLPVGCVLVVATRTGD